MKLLNVFVVILFAIISGTTMIQVNHHVLQTKAQTTNSNKSIDGTYLGTFPCGDCIELDVQLTINNTPHNLDTGTYVLKETYERESTAPRITKGKWDITEEDAANPHSQILSLHSDKPGDNSHVYYRVENSRVLKYLDQNKKEIKSPANLVLVKQ